MNWLLGVYYCLKHEIEILNCFCWLVPGLLSQKVSVFIIMNILSSFSWRVGKKSLKWEPCPCSNLMHDFLTYFCPYVHTGDMLKYMLNESLSVSYLKNCCMLMATKMVLVFHQLAWGQWICEVGLVPPWATGQRGKHLPAFECFAECDGWADDKYTIQTIVNNRLKKNKNKAGIFNRTKKIDRSCV